MNCRYCGSQLEEGVKFCPNCGQVVSPEPVDWNAYKEHIRQNRRVSKVTLLMSAVSVMLAIALAYVLLFPPAQNIAGVGLMNKSFSTPEDAAYYFVEGVKTSDLQKMSEAFAVEEIPKEHDFTTASNFFNAIFPSSSLMPDDYEEFIPFNEVQLLNQCISTYKQILFGFGGIDMNNPLMVEDDSSLNDYIKKLNPDLLKNVKITKFIDSPLSNNEINTENMKKLAAVYGADEIKIYEIELECSGNKLSSDMLEMIRYGSSWYIDGVTFEPGELEN